MSAAGLRAIKIKSVSGGRESTHRLVISFTNRLIRLRVTAFPTLRLTEIPIRTGPSSLRTDRYTTNWRLATDVPLRKVRRKSPRRLRRYLFCKKNASFHFRKTMDRYQYVSDPSGNKPHSHRKKGHFWGVALCGQNLSAFSTAVFQHPASVFGAHALPEAVYILTASVARLKCALHMFTPVSSRHTESLLFSRKAVTGPVQSLP